MLHNSWEDLAGDAFRSAQDIEPSFGLAYWGEALSFKQGFQLTEQTDEAREVLQRMQDNVNVTALPELEQDLLGSVLVQFEGGVNSTTRDARYLLELDNLRKTYPDDLEVALLYVRAALVVASPATYGFEARVAEQYSELNGELTRVLAALPSHPGAHNLRLYLMDTPARAEEALNSAALYPTVAVSCPHAFRMAANIYMRLGRWNRAASANNAAVSSARFHAAWADLPRAVEDYEGLMWLHYTYCQQGRFEPARQLRQLLELLAASSDPDTSMLPARVALMTSSEVVEGENWNLLSAQVPELLACASCNNSAALDGLFEWSTRANIALAFAAGLSASNKEQFPLAEACADQLIEIGQSVGSQAPALDGVAQLGAKILRGSVLYTKGEFVDGAALLVQAVADELALGPAPFGPLLLVPATEVRARLLLSGEIVSTEQATVAYNTLNNDQLRNYNRSSTAYLRGTAADALERVGAARAWYTLYTSTWTLADPVPQVGSPYRIAESWLLSNPDTSTITQRETGLVIVVVVMAIITVFLIVAYTRLRNKTSKPKMRLKKRKGTQSARKAKQKRHEHDGDNYGQLADNDPNEGHESLNSPEW